MKRLILAFFFLLVVQAVFAQHPSADPRWNLVFEDEFNGTTVDLTKWESAPYSSNLLVFDDDLGTCSFYNGSVQAYNVPENATVNSGILSLSCKVVHPFSVDFHCWAEDDPDEHTITATVNYTAADLHSTTHYKYGYFEIRVKMPNRPTNGKNFKTFGTGFWLYAGDCWSELDIFENDYEEAPFRYTNNVHYSPHDIYGDCPDGYALNNESFFYRSMSTGEWHTIACNWTPSRIEYLVDGVVVRVSTETWLSDLDPMTLRLGVAGPRDRSSVGDPNIPLNSSEVQFPFTVQVEYVKIWQLEQDCETDRVYCNDSPDPLDETTTFESITTGGSGCITTFTDNVSLKATNFILLKENTIIPSGGEYILDVERCMDY